LLSLSLSHTHTHTHTHTLTGGRGRFDKQPGISTSFSHLLWKQGNWVSREIHSKTVKRAKKEKKPKKEDGEKRKKKYTESDSIYIYKACLRMCTHYTTTASGGDLPHEL